MGTENVHAAAEALAKVYKDGLESFLSNELVQFVSLIDSYKKDNGKDQSPKLFYYQILEEQISKLHSETLKLH